MAVVQISIFFLEGKQVTKNLSFLVKGNNLIQDNVLFVNNTSMSQISVIIYLQMWSFFWK